MPRLFLLIILNIVLIGLVLAIAPQQAPVTLYKLSLVTLAGLVGYWLDRAIFPYARPDSFQSINFTDRPSISFLSIRKGLELVFAAALIRRAIIVGCAMLAMGLGA
ncbi:MAG: putative holin [Methylotenera sp.]|nr:putative holin [Methylotenera sp.]